MLKLCFKIDELLPKKTPKIIFYHHYPDTFNHFIKFEFIQSIWHSKIV